MRSARETRVTVAWVLLVVVVAAAAVWLRWSDPAPEVTADSWWYAHGALVLSGSTPDQADRQADLLLCGQRQPRANAAAPACTTYNAVTSPRYARIFTSRPLYPLLVAPLVAGQGLARALRIVTFASCVTAALLMYLAVLRSGAARWAALLSVCALFLLPSGFWMTQLNAEAPMMAGMLATVWGVLAWRDGRSVGLAAAASGLGVNFANKPADAVALGLSLCLLAGVAARFDDSGTRRRDLTVVALGATTVVGWLFVSTVLRLPNYTETIQDLATRHFTTPDVPHPWEFVLRGDLGLVRSQAWGIVRLVWPLFVLPAGIGEVVLRLRWRAVPWLAVGGAAILVVAAHPLRSEVPRLVTPLWLPVAAGVGLLAERGVRRLGRRTAPPPVASS